MFFDNDDLVTRKSVRLKALPPTPETGWRPPAEFPRLTDAAAISYDVETFDPELDTAGPGWARKRGHIVGVSVGAMDRQGLNAQAWYFPARHIVEPEYNMPTDNVFGWLKDTLETSTPKIGANLLYDMGWLTEENIFVKGMQYDVQYAEALIDEEAYVNLDALALKYLGIGKEKDALKDWIDEAYRPNKSAWRADIYRASPRLAGPYGEADSLLPLRILPKQWDILNEQSLTQIFNMECRLIPLLIRMRSRGVSVDVERAIELKTELDKDIPTLYSRIASEYGVVIDACTNANLERLFERLGIKFPRAATGKGSFRKEFLQGLDHPVGNEINNIREHEKMSGTFLKAYIIDKNIDGKIYPQFHPLKGDDNGTLVGRFASSAPNLQNIPARTKLGKKIRSCFVPDRTCTRWRKFDYSQIHYRILAHYAVDGLHNYFSAISEFWQSPIGSLWGGTGTADALRLRYINDPDTDYHLDVFKNVAPLMGWDVSNPDVVAEKRRPIKNVNFGLLYGQGEKSLAYKAGMSGDHAKGFFDSYHKGASYVKPTMAAIGAEMQQNGFVRTVLGRRVRFNYWEANSYERNGQPLHYTDALRAYGSNIRRSYEYRSINYKFQGSEPDIMKTGMLNCYDSGVFDYTGYPCLTCHDELDFNDLDDSPQMAQAYAYIQETMQNAVRLRVPVKVDMTVGKNWGDAK